MYGLITVCCIIMLTAFSFPLEASQRSPTGTVRYSYEMGEEEREIFFRALKKIKKGDELKQVKTLLGSPLIEHDAQKKESDKFLFHFIRYKLKVVKRGIANENDHSVTLYFDKSGHLVSAEGHNEPVPAGLLP